jgi:hypothetical protein
VVLRKGDLRAVHHRAGYRPARGLGDASSPGHDQAYRAFAIVVLATTRTHLRRITLFGDPELFERFSLPAEMAPRSVL